MVKDTVRVGMIGCGQISLIHIGRYAKVDGVEIAAVADIDPAALARGAEAAGGARTFGDFRELLALDDIDTVDVCLHNNYHAPVTIAALKAGKDVFCEKPMAGSYADALAMAGAARTTGRKLAVQLNTLFSLETKAAKRIIDSGALGRCYFARSVGLRRRGRAYVDGYGSAQFVQKDVAAGGALYDMGVYHIGQVLYLLGNPEPLTVTGSTYQEIDMYADRKADSGFSVEELGLGYVRLAGGITLSVAESWAVNLGSLGPSCIAGARGGLTLNPLTLHTTEADLEMDAAVQVDAADRRWRSTNASYSALDSAQHHWIATVSGRAGEPIDTAGIALNTMLISEGIYLSQRLGREVTAAEIVEKSKSTAVTL